MNFLGDQTTLVLAGAWNPAILNPNWISRHILENPPESVFKVEMQFPVQGPFGVSPRYTFEGISIIAAQDKLTFFLSPEDPEKVAKNFNVAKKILDVLSHTPIKAMGINFAYKVDPFEGRLSSTVAWADQLGDLIIDDPDARVLNRKWRIGIAALGHMINVDYRADAQGATLKVNHHYEVEGAASKAAEHLTSEGLFQRLLNVSNKLVEGLTSEASDVD